MEQYKPPGRPIGNIGEISGRKEKQVFISIAIR